MADRIDILGDDNQRLEGLSGGALSRRLDDELQACVASAAAEIGAPIALVSLVLARTQFFRAHVGLPTELAVAQATDRDVSFCQFVVRDGEAFEVNDAIEDQRVPKKLVQQFGVRAYLGVPVVANDAVVGSLCVLDTVAREFSETDRQTLVALARKASDRMQALVTEPTGPLIDAGTSPALAEIRNLLMSIRMGQEMAQQRTRELLPIAAVLESSLSMEEKVRALEAVVGSAAAIRDLDEGHESLRRSLLRFERAVLAVDAVVSQSPVIVSIDKIVRAGLELAHHRTKLVGGVEMGASSDAPVIGALSVGALMISSAASMLANEAGAPLAANVEVVGDVVAVHLRSTAEAPVDLDGVVGALARVTPPDSSVSVRAADGALRIEFQRA